nr:1231_t:CDS:2 [Entrophospora candida]
MDTEVTSSKFGSKKGRKLITLTNIQKKELCEYKIANPNQTYEGIGKKFGIGKSTVGDILNEKEKWLAIAENSTDANKKRNRGGEWPQLEEALAIWVNLANEANHTVTGAILSQKSVQFAQKLNISDFKSSQENRIQAYDENQELGVEIPRLNILNAINWTAEAWDSVTDDTIYRCWQRTGILPNEDEEMYEEPNELDNELENEENTVQSLINQMNVDDIMATPSNPISNTVALDNIQNIFDYFQQNSDIKVNGSLISGLKNLQRQIRRKQNASLKQLTLESFYSK